LIDYPHGDKDDPFAELWFHYGLGRGILCPKKNFGKQCPICDFAGELSQKGEKDKELAKTLWPKQRIYAVVVDRADEEASPKFWGFGVSVYKQLIEMLLDEDTRDFMDLKNGRDFSIKSVIVGGKKFPETNLKIKMKTSPLADTDKEIKEIVDSVEDIFEVFKPQTTSEIREALSEWAEGDVFEKAAEDSGGEVEVTKKEDSSATDEERLQAELKKALAGMQE